MEEEFQKNDSLIPEEDWKNEIEKLKSVIQEDSSSDYDALKGRIKEKLVESVKKRTEKLDDFAILFSGGVDSTLIALISRQLGRKFTCYSVGFKDTNFKEPEDLVWAKKISKELGFDFRFKVFSLEEIAKLFKKTVKILGRLTNVVNVGVGAVVVACSEMITQKTVFSGLGSEEIFAGYERHRKNPTNQECWQGLKEMHQRDFLRDTTIAKSLGIKLFTPFLDFELIKEAMKAPIKYKIRGDLTKAILRDVAIELGLPKEFAYRKKRAAQYGSSFDRAILKLTKTNRLSLKKDYLESLK